MKNLPTVSIVIPVLNKKRFITQTLDSIFSQGYPSLEVIIEDGGSTDGTLGVIKKYAKKHKEIIWESRKDKGQADAIERGLKRAKGEILTYINADDVYKKGTLKAVGEYFRRNTKTLWLAGKGETLNDKGERNATFVDSYKNFLLSLNSYSLLLMVNYFFQPSVFLSREAYEKYGPFKGESSFVVEYDLWLKLGKVSMPKVINKSFSGFRITKDSFSGALFKKTLKEDERTAAKYTNNPLILALHYLHNLGRVLTVNLLK